MLIPTLKTFIRDHYLRRCSIKTAQFTADRVESCFPDILHVPVTAVNLEYVERYRVDRLKFGLKNNTVWRDISALSSVLTKAKKWGFLDKNPIHGIDWKYENDGRSRFLSDEEMTRLISALNKRESRIRRERLSMNRWLADRHQAPRPEIPESSYADHLMPMVMISLQTGIRRSELFAAEWDDVDLANKSLRVTGQAAKNGKTRHIPLSRTAMEAFAKWKRSTTGTGLVFQNEDGKRFGHVNTSWRQVLKDADISDFRWHDMRHDFASRVAMSGSVTPRELADWLGHEDLTSTMRYAHVMPRKSFVHPFDAVSATSNSNI